MPMLRTDPHMRSFSPGLVCFALRKPVALLLRLFVWPSSPELARPRCRMALRRQELDTAQGGKQAQFTNARIPAGNTLSLRLVQMNSKQRVRWGPALCPALPCTGSLPVMNEDAKRPVSTALPHPLPLWATPLGRHAIGGPVTRSSYPGWSRL
jgi:hypothetical protein